VAANPTSQGSATSKEVRADQHDNRAFRSSRLRSNQMQFKSRRLDLSDAENDNYWSTSLYSEPPVLTSSRCVKALRDFFAHPSILAVATESCSHPTGIQSVLAQPWLYAGGGLGNIAECPLQSCLAGAGTRRDSITFASVCVPYECHAADLAARDFPASLNLAAHDVLSLVDNLEDDDGVLEFVEHPERSESFDERKKYNTANKEINDERVWWHSSPEQQRALAEEYITLNTRISKLNEFLQTGWTCGNYQVPFEAFPFGIPYFLVCAGLIICTLRGTFGASNENNVKKEKRIFIEADQNGMGTGTQEFLPTNPKATIKSWSGVSSPLTPTYPTQDQSSGSIDSLSSSPSNLAEFDQDAPNDNSEVHQDNRKTHDTSLMSAWNVSKHWHTLCTARHEATACLDGLRVWSILWVILGHVMAIQSSTGGGYQNPVDFLPPSGLTTTFFGQLIFASRFAVDTFLVISGYLLVFVIARKAPTLLANHKSKMTTYFQLIGLRLLRILPMYLLCLGFFTQVAPHMYLVGEDNDGGGPFWYQWDSLLQPCRDYGWTNLLFINNFVPFEKSNTETCFYHSWYLAVDMQLFVLFGLPVTLFAFLKNPKLGMGLTMLLWTTSVLLTAYLAYIRQWSINTFDGLAVAKFDVEAYAKPHVRGQAYFAGMYVAMAQLTRENSIGASRPATSSTWKHQALLWGSVLALGSMTFCTVTGAYARRPCQYTEYPIKDDCGSLWSPTSTFLYTATSRAIWSCSIGIVMTLCLDGKGGWLNRFLSWHVWAPLSQLSFGTYLIHPIVIFVWLLGMREKSVYSLATFGMSFTSVCCVSFAFALIAALVVELPSALLLTQMIKKKKRTKVTTDEAEELLDSSIKSSRSGEDQKGYGATS